MSCKLFCAFVLLGCVLYVHGQHYRLITSDRYAVVGSPFSFTCRGNHSSLISWFVNNTEYRMNGQRRNGHCDLNGVYPKEYTFYCSGDINILTIKSVKLSQQGTVWRYGDDGGRSNEVKLEVRDGPGTSLKLNTSSVVTAMEGSDVTVSCSATCFIKCNYQWKLSDNVISNKGILSLANINRLQSGVYVCTAENPDTKQTANKTLHLIVHHGPGGSLRINSSSDITVEEGSDVTISCKADCFMNCLYRWELTNETVSNNGLLSLTNITKFQDGVYTCTAVNPDTSESAHKQIIINVKQFSGTVEASSQFDKTLGSGFGLCSALSVIIVIGVVLFVRYKRRKEKSTSNQKRHLPNFYSACPVTDKETAPAAEHEDTENPYSTIQERRNDVPDNVLTPDNNETAPAAEHEDAENPYSTIQKRRNDVPENVITPDNNQTETSTVPQVKENPYCRVFVSQP